jgi:hypothetical protein
MFYVLLFKINVKFDNSFECTFNENWPMKNLYFLFLLFSTPSWSQVSSQEFSPHWEIGLQYNSEWNNAIGESAIFTVIDRNSGWSYSWTLHLSYYLTKKWAAKVYFNQANRNLTTTTVRKFTNPLTSESPEIFHTIYLAKEYALGMTWNPYSNDRLFFSSGLGLSNFSHTTLRSDKKGNLTASISWVDPDNGLFGNNRLFIFFETCYSFFKSETVQFFLIPQFKMNFTSRNIGHLKQQYFNFGIGIGGSIRIGN